MNRSVLSPLRASRRSGAVPTRAVLCYVGRACAATTLALLLSSLVSSPVSADEPPFTLAEAQRVALSRSKQLEASQLGVSASKALGIAAGERPDPVAKIGLENLPINGPERFSVQRDFMTMRSVGIMQEITRPSKLRARAAESEEAVRLAEAKKVQVLVALRRDSALAWLNRYYAEAADRTVLQQLEAVRLEVTAADAAYRGGHGTAADVLAARQAFAEFEDLASESSREVSAAKLALDRWVPGASDHALVGNPAIDAIPLHKHGLDAQLARHPEILALSQRGIGYSNMVTLELTVPLEIRRASRQDQRLAAKLAEASQAKAEREDMLREHAAEIATMIDAWDSARERLERYRTSIVPLATDRVVAARAAYRGGKATLTDLLTSHRAEIDARLKALQLEAIAARLWAQLAFLEAPPESLAAIPVSVDADQGVLP
ncbi:MAG: TolC family protein [Gammaproteobacteria bacterium]|nr:MAG: TolC family protein [Gammaproteobacteria bacterium]